MIDAGTQNGHPHPHIPEHPGAYPYPDNCGMATILKKTSDAVYRDIGYRPTDIELQAPFEDGILDLRPGGILYKGGRDRALPQKAVRETFEEVIDLIAKFVPDLGTYKVIIITGGTSAAWKDLFREKFSNMRSISFMPGNTTYYQNMSGSGNYTSDSMPIEFANVSGYYKYLYMTKTRR